MAALTIFPTPVPAYRRPPRPGMDERERLLIRCLEANARARELVDLTAVLRTELVERRLELQAGRTECRSLVDQLLNGRLRIVPDGRGPSPRRSHAVPVSTRDQLVLTHTGLARSLARRYLGRGELLDDLSQVAMLGLVKASRRYDPEHGSEFSSFATSTIIGELKRHFRDRRWMMHVRRSDQERYLATRNAIDRMVASLGRSPSVSEVATATGLTSEQVEDAMETARALQPSSIDALIGDSVLKAEPASSDPSFEQVDDRLAAAGVIATLPSRNKELLSLRFVEGLSQSQIAARIGVSQMHVSRMLASTLAQVRSRLDSDGAL